MELCRTLKNNMPFFGVVLFSFLFSCIGEWRPFFFDIDEPKYVSAALEMAISGDWLHPMLGGLPRVEKPPLPYWLAAPLFKYFGTDFSNGTLLFISRIPSIACSLLTVIATLLIGKKLYSVKTGIFAALLLCVAPAFKIEGMMFKADIIYTAAVTWAAYFYLGLYKGENKTANLTGATICTALGVLTKGPFALPPLVGYLLATYFRRKNKQGAVKTISQTLKKEWSTIFTGLLACAPFMIWIFAASMDNMPYLSGMLGDFSHNTSDRGNLFIFYSKSIGFYLLEALVVFFPLGAFTIGALHNYFRDREWKKNDTSLLVWTALIYLFICFFMYRLRAHRYFLPIMPFLAVIIVNWLLKAERDRYFKIFFKAGTLLIAAISIVASSLTLFTNEISVNLWRNAPVTDFLTQTIPFTLAVFLMGALSIFCFFKYKLRPEKYLAAAFAGTLMLYPFYFNAAPGPDSSGKMLPAAVLGEQLSVSMAEKIPANCMITASRHTLRLHPDLHFFLRKTTGVLNEGYLTALPFDAQMFSNLLMNPAIALSMLEGKERNISLPLTDFLKNRRFRKSVLILSGYEITMLYRNSIYLNKKYGAPAMSVPVQGMNVSWDNDLLYYVTMKAF